jgi:hypothetical protein
MLVSDLFMSCHRINVFRRIERSHYTVFLDLSVRKMTTSKFDYYAALTVGFLRNRVGIQCCIVIYAKCQSTF